MKRVLTLAGMLACISLVFSYCTKQAAIKPPVAPTDSLVTTPFGLMPSSQVHHIEEGYTLVYKGDHLLKVSEKTGTVAADFGVQKKVQLSGALSPTFGRAAVQPPGLGSGWITYAQNSYNVAPADFSNDFIVPNNPTTYHGQLLYLFQGLQDGVSATSHILQPVLQFGPNGRFGGNYWCVNNWYVGCSGCAVYYATPATVTAGTKLESFMTQAASTTATGLYNVSSYFQYITYINGNPAIARFPTSNKLTVNGVPQLNYVFETMEAYSMQTASDYPPDQLVRMADIYLLPIGWPTGRPGSNVPPPPALNWIPVNAVTDIGQHTVIASPTEVDLYFRP